MAFGVNMKVRCYLALLVDKSLKKSSLTVDYILFMTADVTVNANPNEIRDYKYVDKAELQAMFEDQSTFIHFVKEDVYLTLVLRIFFHSMVQVDRP